MQKLRESGGIVGCSIDVIQSRHVIFETSFSRIFRPGSISSPNTRFSPEVLFFCCVTMEFSPRDALHFGTSAETPCPSSADLPLVTTEHFCDNTKILIPMFTSGCSIDFDSSVSIKLYLMILQSIWQNADILPSLEPDRHLLD